MPNPLHAIRAVCFDWGGTLMSEDGPDDIPMGDWPQVAVIDGAVEALRMLHGRLPLAVATNASVSTRPLIGRALRRAGLDGFFAEVFCYTEIGCRKDERGFWQVVERGLQVPMDRIAMVGDSHEPDAAAPRRFGVQGVWFNPAGLPPPPSSSPAGVSQVGRLPLFAAWVLGAREPG